MKDKEGELPPVSRHNRHGSYADSKKKVINGLRRVEGQIRGMQRMVEDERYCVDVLNQIAAARMALARLAIIILEDHTDGCVSKAILEEDAKSKDEIIQELMLTVKRLMR